MKRTFVLRKPFLLLFPVFLVIAIWFTRDPSSYPPVIDSGVHEATISDTLPELMASMDVYQVQGIRLTKETGISVFYFEYLADHKKLVSRFTTLEFSLDSLKVDLQLREAELEAQQHIKSLLGEAEIKKYFAIPNDEYVTLECIKGSEHHYVLLSKYSDRVVHLVEVS